MTRMDELIKQYALLLERYHALERRYLDTSKENHELGERLFKVENVLHKLPNAETLDAIAKQLADVKVMLELKGHSPFGSRGRKVGT